MSKTFKFGLDWALNSRFVFAVYDSLPLEWQHRLYDMFSVNPLFDKTSIKMLGKNLIAALQNGTAVSDKRNEVSAFLKKHPKGLLSSKFLKLFRCRDSAGCFVFDFNGAVLPAKNVDSFSMCQV